MTIIRHTKPWLFPGFLLLVACSHDSKRDNPLDPELTPPVELAVALNDAAGTATLTWTPYEGTAAFARYLVLRNISDRTQVDTLAVNDVSQTSYIDSAMEANTAYQYRISVVNASGFEMPSQEQSTTGYSANAVTLFEPVLDQQRGGVILRWSRFAGPRFTAYRIDRFSTDLIDFEPIARFESIGDTTFTDNALVSDVSYSYRIVVEAAGNTWESNRTGRIRFSAAPVFILAIEFDGRDGTSSLAWSRYTGDQPFESYQVRRRIAGESTTEIRATITDESQTSFVDTDVEVGRLYIYIVTVISTNGAELASDPLEAFFPLEPSVMQAEFDRHGLTAELSWTRAAVGFEYYEIRRRALHGGTTSIIATVTDIEDTTFFDGDLEENTEYDYTVVTRSAAGREVESAAITGPILPKIAFYTNRDGQWEVYVMGADGSNPVNLTNHPAWDGPDEPVSGDNQVGRPAWSPDGSQIAFVSYRDGGNSEIFLMDADGSNPVNISNHPDSDGTNQMRITDNPGKLDIGPTWSPDGNRIAFWSVWDDHDSGNIYVMNTDGSGITQLTDTVNWDFDPDGTQLVYLGNSGRGWFIVDADGRSDPVQINTGGGWPDWSPDGTQIAYACGERGAGLISVYPTWMDQGRSISRKHFLVFPNGVTGYRRWRESRQWCIVDFRGILLASVGVLPALCRLHLHHHRLGLGTRGWNSLVLHGHRGELRLFIHRKWT